MKKLFLGLIAFTVILSSCNNEDEMVKKQEVDIDMSDFYAYTEVSDFVNGRTSNEGKNCFSMAVLNRNLDENPGLYQKMYNIEKNTRKFIA